jgi:Condensation domain
MSDISTRIAALSPEKRKLLLQRLNPKKEIQTQSRESNIFPLSFSQQRLWFLDRLQPGNTAFNIFQPVRLMGKLDVAALEQSFKEVVKRHEILRTTFTLVEGQPSQIIHLNDTFNVLVIDLQQLTPERREIEAIALAQKESQYSFNLAKGSLIRVTLLKLSETEHILLLTLHHIVADGWSIGVLIREIKALYEAFSKGNSSPLPDLPIQYADFAVWQRNWLQGEQLKAQLAYWKQQLNDISILELPRDRDRPKVQTYCGARESLCLDKYLTKKLKNLYKTEGITLFMVLLAAFQTLLHWYARQEDIVIGTDIANRNQPEVLGSIGFFVNQLVLRTNFAGNPTFAELLLRVREMTLDAYTHQDVPFDILVDALKPKRELNRSPFFQVKFILENTPTSSLELMGLTATHLNVTKKTTQLDLLLELAETEKGIVGALEYNTDLFDATTIRSMAKHYDALLSEIAINPQIELNELLKLLTKNDEQNRLIQQQKRKETFQQKLTQVKRKVVRATTTQEAE